MPIIIDSDILTGFFAPNDGLHSLATRLLIECRTQGADIYVTATTLAEFATVLRKYVDLQDIQSAVSIVEQSYILVDVNAQLMKNSLSRFNKQTNNKNTLFDCVVMAAAEKYNAVCVLSHDEGIKKNGFTLAEDYFKIKN